MLSMFRPFSSQPVTGSSVSPMAGTRPTKLPRRLSSTPKASTAPLLDLSLEDAVLSDPTGEERWLAEGGKDSGGWREKFDLARETRPRLSKVDVSSGRFTPGTKGKRKERGLTVSFVRDDEVLQADGNGETGEAGLSYTAEKELGASLVQSLNSSRFGALERSLSPKRQTRSFPRKYQGDDPRLGYDWIAGLLDGDSYLADCDDGYFEDLKEFRRVNSSECYVPKEAR